VETTLLITYLNLAIPCFSNLIFSLVSRHSYSFSRRRHYDRSISELQGLLTDRRIQEAGLVICSSSSRGFRDHVKDLVIVTEMI
jgi:hypothetical protein